MKKAFSILFFLSLITNTTLCFAQTESTIRNQAITRLSQIYQGHIGLRELPYPYFLPTPDGVGGPAGNCPNDICWIGSLSSLDSNGSANYMLKSIRYWSAYNCPNSLTVDVGALGGDVRFTCRRQGASPNNVWCFAYRCEHASPAGCRQKWRLRFKLEADGSEVPVDCFDVGNTGVCTGGFTVEPYGNCPAE